MTHRVSMSVLSALLGAVLAAAPAPPLKTDAASLADLHAQRKVACEACHGRLAKGAKVRLDDNETKPNQACIQCHGGLKEVGADAKGHINPHLSHLGEISCTVCHSGHQASRATCMDCHGFELKMAGAGAPPRAEPKGGEGWKSVRVPEQVPANLKADRADVVVVGSGAAALVAAITAHDAGAKVVVLEKRPYTGGNSMLAAGGMNAAETVFQAKKGIKDSRDLMFQDTMKGGKNINDPDLVRVLAKESSASIDFLTRLGADMSDVGRLGGASLDRAHRPSGGLAVGAHIVDVLRRNAAERRMDVRVNSRVVKILEDKAGHVTGVLVEGRHRGMYLVRAKAVVLAAGGFSANPERVAHFRPEFKGMTSSNQPGATGDGVDLGEATRAELKHMDQIQIHPSVAAGSRILITEAVRGNGAILLNREGKRFINEITTRDTVSQAILKQGGKSAFLLFDEGVRKSLGQIEGYFHLELVKTGETPADLAKVIGLPPDAVEASLEAYNRAFDAKSDPDFKRPDLPRALRTPKFYAIEVQPGVHYTMGGLRIDPETRVIAQDGKPIPGFFAAGEVTGGVHGANRLGGNSISETITFGRIAGRNAAALAKTPKG